METAPCAERSCREHEPLPHAREQIGRKRKEKAPGNRLFASPAAPSITATQATLMVLGANRACNSRGNFATTSVKFAAPLVTDSCCVVRCAIEASFPVGRTFPPRERSYEPKTLPACPKGASFSNANPPPPQAGSLLHADFQAGAAQRL